ncbi:hypothetical protein CG50_11765 [Paenirhodobacter enshiensis]|uniref:Uncharacterized protein n=1 Tax=Paenirhodobacter enshiensis TaxID=1105367 RepID=A0A086Y3N0_9RHOB|nr:hypothetical protein CG50_11765 [Paenirhodobacter enshiensis]
MGFGISHGAFAMSPCLEAAGDMGGGVEGDGRLEAGESCTAIGHNSSLPAPCGSRILDCWRANVKGGTDKGSGEITVVGLGRTEWCEKEACRLVAEYRQAESLGGAAVAGLEILAGLLFIKALADEATDMAVDLIGRDAVVARKRDENGPDRERRGRIE